MRVIALSVFPSLLVACGGPSSPDSADSSDSTSPRELRRRLEQLQEQVNHARALEEREQRGETLTESEQRELDRMRALREAGQRGFEGALDRRRQEVIAQRLTGMINRDSAINDAHGPVQEVILQRVGDEIRYTGHAVLADGATAEVRAWEESGRIREQYQRPEEW